jgi:hypothetical protein
MQTEQRTKSQNYLNGCKKKIAAAKFRIFLLLKKQNKIFNYLKIQIPENFLNMIEDT